MEIKTTQFLWAISFSVWLPSEEKVSYYLFVAIDSFPAVGLHWEESVSFSITPHNQTFIHIDKILWAAFSSSGWTALSPPPPLSLTLQSLSQLHCPPLLCLFQSLPLCLVLGASELGSEIQMCFTRAAQRGRITCHNLLAMLFLMQPWTLYFDVHGHIDGSRSARGSSGPKGQENFIPLRVPAECQGCDCSRLDEARKRGVLHVDTIPTPSSVLPSHSCAPQSTNLHCILDEDLQFTNCHPADQPVPKAFRLKFKIPCLL